MYGRIFESLYEGSMVGSGTPVFAVWGYVIAKMKPDKDVGAQVDLNPTLLSFILGDKESVIEGAIAKLCRPDPKSTTPDNEGRRLVKLGQFSYQVVNGAKYMAIRNEEERRRSNRESQQRLRERRKGKVKPNELQNAGDNGGRQSQTGVADTVRATDPGSRVDSAPRGLTVPDVDRSVGSQSDGGDSKTQSELAMGVDREEPGHFENGVWVKD